MCKGVCAFSVFSVIIGNGFQQMIKGVYLTHDSNRMVDSAAGHHDRSRALDEGSLYVAHHRHFFGRNDLRGRELPTGDPHDVSGDGGQGRQQCQHPRIPRHPRHPRRGDHALGCDERLR